MRRPGAAAPPALPRYATVASSINQVLQRQLYLVKPYCPGPTQRPRDLCHRNAAESLGVNLWQSGNYDFASVTNNGRTLHSLSSLDYP